MFNVTCSMNQMHALNINVNPGGGFFAVRTGGRFGAPDSRVMAVPYERHG